MRIYTVRLPNDFIPDAQTDDSDGSNLQITTLALSFDTRQKSRFRATLDTGEDIGVDLSRTSVLRGGAYIATADGEILQILAAPQTVMQVSAADSYALMRGAYHLGNRHVPLMLTPEALYLEPDHVLADMLEGIGLTVTTTEFPFEPETGAYAHHHDVRLRPLSFHHAH
jgi:urease accessory protein